VHFRTGTRERDTAPVDGNEKDGERRERGRLVGSGMRIGESGKAVRRGGAKREGGTV